MLPESVAVHPLVLLSVTDHYARVARNTTKRVVGLLLGQNNGKTVNVANSFAVPFEEDERDPSIWFLDHNYLESMTEMLRKVNASEKIIGWYHSGPKLRSADLAINDVIRRYTPSPVLVVIDVRPDAVGLPTNAYMAIEEIQEDGSASKPTFHHISSEIQAEEAEEIGVEHLLRDVKDNAVGSLATRVSTQKHSLSGLQARLADIAAYLAQVVDGSLPVNHPILYNLQNIFNLMPNISEDMVKAFTVKTNDQLLATYVSGLCRAVIALHNLINNKVENREAELEHVNADSKSDKKEDKEKGKEEDKENVSKNKAEKKK